MPDHLPALLVIRRLSQQSVDAVAFVLRATIVCLVWLAFLPWLTMWTMRMYLVMAESV
jgi:E3 ubiquitin-protein ligase MARCH6